MDCKATVKIGEFSCGGLTRGDHRASDHDMGCQEKYVPCGIVDEENGALPITFAVRIKRVTSSSIRSKPSGRRWRDKRRQRRV